MLIDPTTDENNRSGVVRALVHLAYTLGRLKGLNHSEEATDSIAKCMVHMLVDDADLAREDDRAVRDLLCP